jgi:hypothetical protein
MGFGSAGGVATGSGAGCGAALLSGTGVAAGAATSAGGVPSGADTRRFASSNGAATISASLRSGAGRSVRGHSAATARIGTTQAASTAARRSRRGEDCGFPSAWRAGGCFGASGRAGLRLDRRCRGLPVDGIRLRRRRHGGGAFLETIGKAVPHRGDLAPLVGFLLVIRGALGLRPARLGAGPIVAGIVIVTRLHQPDHSRCAPDRSARTPAIFKSATEPSTVNGIRGAHEPRTRCALLLCDASFVFSGFLSPWTPCGYHA